MDKMEEFISLGSVAPKASLYEGAEAVALLLCRECVPELAGTGLPKDLQAAVLYAVDKDVTVTDKGKVTELVLPRGTALCVSSSPAPARAGNARPQICAGPRAMPCGSSSGTA